MFIVIALIYYRTKNSMNCKNKQGPVWVYFRWFLRPNWFGTFKCSN